MERQYAHRGNLGGQPTTTPLAPFRRSHSHADTRSQTGGAAMERGPGFLSQGSRPNPADLQVRDLSPKPFKDPKNARS
jgi:hypothetical protein